jgi:hypothetical protein
VYGGRESLRPFLPTISFHRHRWKKNLWDIDSDKAGDWCLTNPASVTFWRISADRENKVTLSDQSGSTQLQWAKGQQKLAWQALPSLTSFRLSSGGSTRGEFTIHHLSADERNESDLRKSLADRHCLAQLAEVERILDGND